MLKFTKYQALGNDFIVIEDFEEKIKLSYEEVKKLCHRHFGVGADGLILVRSHPSYDCLMDYFNADGTQAEVCGNGLRCLAKHLYEQGLTKKKTLKILTLSGPRDLVFLPQKGKDLLIQVDLGEPKIEPLEIPILFPKDKVVNKEINTPLGKFKATCLSMGNPHCVIFVDEEEKVDLGRVGPAIENLSLFPKKTNVELVKVENRTTLTLKVWERGVGETLACGSGAAASLVASVLNKLSERKVTVHLPGGALKVEWAGNNHVYLTGPAEKVFTGTTDINAKFKTKNAK